MIAVSQEEEEKEARVMREIYHDSRQDFRVWAGHLPHTRMKELLSITDGYMKIHDNRSNIVRTVTSYFDFFFDTILSTNLIHTIEGRLLYYVPNLPHGITPVGKFIVSYRRYRLEKGKTTVKSVPCSITKSCPGHGGENNPRLSLAYDLDPASKRKAYTAVMCLRKAPSIKGGQIVFYPNYYEDNTITSMVGQLVSQCNVSLREIDIPFGEGDCVLLTGDTYFTMEAMSGEGECVVLFVDFYVE